MLISAILVVGARSVLSATTDDSLPGDGPEPPAHPIASPEVLGQSVVERTIARLQSAGITAVSVVSEAALSPALGRRFVPDILMKQSRKGFGRVLLARLGAYAEIDFADLLRFHHNARASVTRVCDTQGPLDFWLLDSAPQAPSALNLDLTSDLTSEGAPPSAYLTNAYVNRLTDARDLRRLAVDALVGRNAIRPRGREIKPGVWVDDGARIHRSARIVAPAYIGRGTRVRASALITRYSNVERRCLVDYGTAIEDSSMLPYTYVGRGLDVAHSVVDGGRLVNLARNVAVTIEDAKIIGRTVTGRLWLGYGDKRAEMVRPSAPEVELESIQSVTQRQHPALRVLSKGEV